MWSFPFSFALCVRLGFCCSGGSWGSFLFALALGVAGGLGRWLVGVVGRREGERDAFDWGILFLMFFSALFQEFVLGRVEVGRGG